MKHLMGTAGRVGPATAPKITSRLIQAFIATLPGDDPLFVAENNEDLAELEDPTLMRQFGLIRANMSMGLRTLPVNL